MRTLVRLLRWILAAPLRVIGNRHVRIAGVLAITAAFLASRPTDPAFYGVCGGFLVISILARPLGRWITPKPQRRVAVLPAAPSRPAPVQAAPSPPPPALPPLLPDGPQRPLPSPVVIAVSAPMAFRSPNEREIRVALPARLQQLLDDTLSL